jgi:hypothetical protein
MDFLGKRPGGALATDRLEYQLNREHTQANIDLLEMTSSSFSDTKRMAYATGGITAHPSTLETVYDEGNKYVQELRRLDQQMESFAVDIGRVLNLQPNTVRGMTTEQLTARLDEVLPAQQLSPRHTPS